MNTLIVLLIIAALCLVIPALWSTILTVGLWILAITLICLAVYALAADLS